MPTTVYTSLCQTDRTGEVLGVFADRAHAAETARCCAAAHAEKLRRQDQQTFKASIAADIYEVHVDDLDSNVTVSIRHRFLDEPESSLVGPRVRDCPESGVRSQYRVGPPLQRP
jgi:hypothetical protein